MFPINGKKQETLTKRMAYEEIRKMHDEYLCTAAMIEARLCELKQQYGSLQDQDELDFMRKRMDVLHEEYNELIEDARAMEKYLR